MNVAVLGAAKAFHHSIFHGIRFELESLKALLLSKRLWLSHNSGIFFSLPDKIHWTVLLRRSLRDKPMFMNVLRSFIFPTFSIQFLKIL